MSENDMFYDGGSTVRELNKRLLEDSDDGEGNDAGKYDARQTQRSSKGKSKRRRPNSGSESESVSNGTERALVSSTISNSLSCADTPNIIPRVKRFL